jgi:FkbM family methyltransferase
MELKYSLNSFLFICVQVVTIIFLVLNKYMKVNPFIVKSVLLFLVFLVLVSTSFQHKREFQQKRVSQKRVSQRKRLGMLSAAGGTKLSSSFMSCMIDVGDNLPISSSGELLAHHWDAGTGRWNDDIRFNPFLKTMSQSPLILDIGGHIAATDSEHFLEIFPAAKIHIYEPVPVFFSELKQRWLGRSCCTLHNFGMGGSARSISLSASDLAGQSTYVMNNDGGGDNSTAIHILDGRAAIANFLSSGSHQIDILHINCEGCEWEFLERLASTDMFRFIAILQVSFHNYGANGIGEHIYQYCLIREALEQSHYPVNSVPFAWERWVRRDMQ